MRKNKKPTKQVPYWMIVNHKNSTVATYPIFDEQEAIRVHAHLLNPDYKIEKHYTNRPWDDTDDKFHNF